MRRAICSVVIAAAALVALPAEPASAHRGVWGSESGVLTFRSDRDGRGDVFTMDAIGAEPRNLTAGAGLEDSQPAWSPDGERIAYVRLNRETGKPDLYVMGSAGGSRTRLTKTPLAERDPAWSGDGSRVVFAARISPAGPFRIFSVEADGTGLTQLTTQDNGRADRSPVSSPDGTQIAFTSDRTGGFPDLYVMNADGTGVRRLTANVYIEGNPTWSPDGTRIAVESCCEGGSSDIWIVDVVSRSRTNLTATSVSMEFDPAWSPDGARIAFVAFDVGARNIDIWTMAADGSDRVRVTTHDADDLSPDWQPLPTCTITGTRGPDALQGTEGDDVICAGGDADVVRAGAGEDLVYGGRGDDDLAGEDGADTLYGEQGNDLLAGAAAFDVLDGGVGTDTCSAGGQGAWLRLCEL